MQPLPLSLPEWHDWAAGACRRRQPRELTAQQLSHCRDPPFDPGPPPPPQTVLPCRSLLPGNAASAHATVYFSSLGGASCQSPVTPITGGGSASAQASAFAESDGGNASAEADASAFSNGGSASASASAFSNGGSASASASSSSGFGGRKLLRA